MLTSATPTSDSKSTTPASAPTSPAQVVWFEVVGQDHQRLQSFYSELFGWKYDPTPDGSYGVVGCPDEGLGIPGGVGKAPAGPGHVTFYVQVADLEGTLARAEAMGGEIVMPPTVLPTVTVALFKDPEGHLVGLAGG